MLQQQCDCQNLEPNELRHNQDESIGVLQRENIQPSHCEIHGNYASICDLHQHRDIDWIANVTNHHDQAMYQYACQNHVHSELQGTWDT